MHTYIHTYIPTYKHIGKCTVEVMTVMPTIERKRNEGRRKRKSVRVNPRKGMSIYMKCMRV